MKFAKPLSCTCFLLIGLVIFVSCHGQNSTPEKISSNSTTKQKRIFIDSFPQPKAYISDYENIYTPEQETVLDTLIAGFEKSNGIQIAIITFDTSMIAKDSLDAVTLRIANEWGVGQKYGNNGLTIGISIGYRKIRIQNGLGIEKILSNNETQEIIDNKFLPNFSNGQFYRGTLQGLQALMTKLIENKFRK